MCCLIVVKYEYIVIVVMYYRELILDRDNLIFSIKEWREYIVVGILKKNKWFEMRKSLCFFYVWKVLIKF